MKQKHLVVAAFQVRICFLSVFSMIFAIPYLGIFSGAFVRQNKKFEDVTPLPSLCM